MLPYTLTGRESHNPVVSSLRVHRSFRQRKYARGQVVMRRDLRLLSRSKEKLDELVDAGLTELLGRDTSSQEMSDASLIQLTVLPL